MELAQTAWEQRELAVMASAQMECDGVGMECLGIVCECNRWYGQQDWRKGDDR
jgi:hypothetical protein